MFLLKQRDFQRKEIENEPRSNENGTFIDSTQENQTYSFLWSDRDKMIKTHNQDLYINKPFLSDWNIQQLRPMDQKSYHRNR